MIVFHEITFCLLRGLHSESLEDKSETGFKKTLSQPLVKTPKSPEF